MLKFEKKITKTAENWNSAGNIRTGTLLPGQGHSLMTTRASTSRIVTYGTQEIITK
jgi:hypothetical protein